MRAVIAFLFTVFLAGLSAGFCAGGANADQLVTDISENEIELKYSFSGRTLLLFGAIDHAIDQSIINAGADPVGPYDVVLRITGPNTALVVRKKERVAGIWVNADSVIFPSVPGYYAVASSRPLPDIATAKVLGNLDLGLDQVHLLRAQNEGARADGEDDNGFREGLSRSMQRAGLYGGEGSVTVIKNTLFRGEFRFPSNVPEGNYHAEAFLFLDGRFLTREEVPLHVGKTGMARAVYAFANESPAIYGLVAVLVALTAGWIVGVLAKK